MIRLAALGKRFGERWIFRDLSLAIKSGESVAIIGPSGGGKSVLLKMMCGLILPDEGSVEWGVEWGDEREAANLGMLFQRNALFDSLTVIENLLFPLRERKGLDGPEALVRAQDMLEAVGLAEAADLYPDEISGGMQKRLGIARTLVVEPETVLYDEPTAGLDPITSRRIADLILSLRDGRIGGSHGGIRASAHGRSMTLVTVTNDMHRAYQLADRVCLLSGGKLRDGGTPDQLRTTKDPELHEFITGDSASGDPPR